MGIDFYYHPASAPCRAVTLTAKAVGVELNLKITDVQAGDNKTPEYLKMNPQHTIPTMNDNGFCIWESRAICSYLVNKYGKGDSLYPKEPKARAIVDQRLYFDMGTLYQRFADYYYPIFFGGTVDPAKKTKMDEALKFLETFLDGQTWVAGPNMTIADLSMAATISTFEAVDNDLTPYSNISRWLAKMKTSAPGYEEANGAGIEMFKKLLATLKNKKIEEV